jgi:hypothetical protein
MEHNADTARGAASPRVPKDMLACHELAKAIAEEWLRMGYSDSVPDAWLGPLAHAAARTAMTHNDGGGAGE